ncbi:hypothetical protein [Fredinandcohnia sp. 179-A 10B2 NHS]|uniref:hypothetical protein n=1 Tax=Fredinandcohnia sp. 179-A 10B2 NHS TaxID=3235176 RepID=UPI0039A10FE6
MIRTGAAAFLSVFLLIIEGFIVMKIKNYTAIQFDNMPLLLSVLAMNFFLAFSILTHIKMWMDNKSVDETEAEHYK